MKLSYVIVAGCALIAAGCAQEAHPTRAERRQLEHAFTAVIADLAHGRYSIRVSDCGRSAEPGATPYSCEFLAYGPGNAWKLSAFWSAPSEEALAQIRAPYEFEALVSRSEPLLVHGKVTGRVATRFCSQSYRNWDKQYDCVASFQEADAVVADFIRTHLKT